MDSANLYKTLTEQVVPMFFDRDAQGIPRKWIQRIRRAMATLVPQFTTHRMVQEYSGKILSDEVIAKAWADALSLSSARQAWVSPTGSG